MAQPKKKLVFTVETDTYSTDLALKIAQVGIAALADVKSGNSGVRVTGVAVR